MKTFVSSLSYKSDALLKHTCLLRLNITNFSRGLESFRALMQAAAEDLFPT